MTYILKCPKCDAKLDYIKRSIIEYSTGSYTLSSDGYLEEDDCDLYDRDGREYECPECGYECFDSDEFIYSSDESDECLND